MLKNKDSIKKLILLLAIIILSILAHYYYHKGVINPQWFFHLLRKHSILAPIIFVTIYFIAATIMLPTLPLNLMAGILFSSIYGGILSTFGSSIGAVVAFLLSRYLFKQPLTKKYNIKFVDYILRKFEHNSWKTIAFIRLNPVIPTGPLNYMLGLTKISTFTYCWASILFLFPPSLAFSFAGKIMAIYITKGIDTSLLKMIFITFLLITLVCFLVPATIKKIIKHKNKESYFENDPTCINP